jgi:hypothetical protein
LSLAGHGEGLLLVDWSWHTDRRVIQIYAAHGSPSSSRPAQSAARIKDEIIGLGEFADVRLGFVDETPSIAEVAVCAAPAICLPLLFATRAGHVQFDVPAALTEAGLTRPLLTPLGDGREIPADRRCPNGPFQGAATAGTVRNPIPPMI